MHIYDPVLDLSGPELNILYNITIGLESFCKPREINIVWRPTFFDGQAVIHFSKKNFLYYTYNCPLENLLNLNVLLQEKIDIIKQGIIDNMLIPVLCPICGNAISNCSCINHIDNDRVRVVMDHLYLYDEDQQKHLINLQRLLDISYSDDKLNKILISEKMKSHKNNSVNRTTNWIKDKE